MAQTVNSPPLLEEMTPGRHIAAAYNDRRDAAIQKGAQTAVASMGTSAFKGALAAAAIVVAGMAASGVLMHATGVALSTPGAPVQDAVQAGFAGLTHGISVMLTQPVGWAIAAFGALVGAGYADHQHKQRAAGGLERARAREEAAQKAPQPQPIIVPPQPEQEKPAISAVELYNAKPRASKNGWSADYIHQQAAKAAEHAREP